MIKMRLDIYLTQNRFTDSRSKSKVIIDAGRVSVNGKTITKSSYDICDGDKIEVSPSDTTEYVGRGGIKLEKALEVFDISPSGLVCADIGASTGGFTECLLNSGAKKVLLPITSAADLGSVPSELVGSFNLIFYATPQDAVFKALGVE